MCLVIISAHRSQTGAVSSATAENPFLALKKQFLQNTMSKRLQFPLKFKGKAVIRVLSLGKRQF